ncbi:acyl-CoA N-acyltransferase [Mycena rosella]|uniref:Acyl-CoA N-acyltransferase n=1 Tax=Mycena rosella TaxID=1033263 RepID=A0AAD7GZB0_MYCRO|nr:acyl-CoA N-acyltransferase [Mycena rosella]
MVDVMLLPATSPELKARCIEIRKTVFVQEQGYVHLDEDNQPEDAGALHFLLADSANIDAGFMGTARLSARPEHTYILSRIALLPSSRGNGNGAKLIQALETWVFQQPGFHIVQLEAQEGTYGFYEKLGYTRQTPEPYIKDRKPHLLMMKDLWAQRTE